MRSWVKKLVRRIGRSRISRLLLAGALEEVNSRLNIVEYRSINRRFYAIEQCVDYLVGAKIGGDYLEFGVYRGDTFSYAYQLMAPSFPDMRFLAFDSFEGLPAPQGIDNLGGYDGNFHKAEFSCSQEEFRRHVFSKGVDPKRIEMVPGWFDKTLLPEAANKYGVKQIAVAWIDCDFYESTVPVLKFITPYLIAGSVIIFDDWRCYRNHPDFGEQRACREWLEANPQIQLAELISFGWNGIAFTVTRC